MQKLSLLFLVLIVTPFVSIHAEEFNAGIVQGLWYSQEKLFVDEPTRIYVAIRNNTGSDLTGTIEFQDGEKRLERKNVQALNGRIIESWSDWRPAYGTHTLSAILSRTELSTIGSSTEKVEVISATTKDVVFVDYDTDGDMLGNTEDTDDDEDGVTDVQERTNGTNPLVSNKQIEEITTTLDDTENDDTNTNDDNSAETKKPTGSNGGSEGRAGLEQFLAPSPAETTLSGVTTYITKAKTSLDSYREERKERKDNSKSQTTQETVNQDGFGEVERSTDAEKKKFNFPKFDGGGFLDKLFSGIGKLFSGIYTFILATVSVVLGHPIFVQMGLLLLILYLLIRTARKFGRRPKRR